MPNAGSVSRRALMLWLLVAGVGTARARLNPQPTEVAAEVAGAREAGGGRLTWFGLAVYDARLWVGDGFVGDSYERSTFALEIRYARSIDGERIVERSLAEMNRQGSPVEAGRQQRWLATMTEAFPDVVAGDRITGVHRPGDSTRFYFNGALRAEIDDAGFAERFFAIWLAPRTPEPQLRRELLGLGRAGS